jgi:hypothetical protein
MLVLFVVVVVGVVGGSRCAVVKQERGARIGQLAFRFCSSAAQTLK